MTATDPTRLPKTPAGYLEAWSTVQRTWADTIAIARTLPPIRLTERVDGQWSMSENLRHLVFATDSWVRRVILGIPEPYWPGGVPHDEAADEDGIDVTAWGIDPGLHPAFDEIVAVFDDRVTQVGSVVAQLTARELARVCDRNPGPGNPEDTERPVARCLDVWVREAWAHHGYVVRDLPQLSG